MGRYDKILMKIYRLASEKRMVYAVITVILLSGQHLKSQKHENYWRYAYIAYMQTFKYA